MEFPYTKVLDFPKHQKRTRFLPWVRVGIFNPKDSTNIIYTLGLVDSGADVTIIDREVGEELGYELGKGISEEIVGLGGAITKGYAHKVGYLLEDPDNNSSVIKYRDIAIFIKNKFPATMPQQTAIFGTIGFFRHLMVTFIFPKSILIDTLKS